MPLSQKWFVARIEDKEDQETKIRKGYIAPFDEKFSDSETTYMVLFFGELIGEMRFFHLLQLKISCG